VLGARLLPDTGPDRARAVADQHLYQAKAAGRDRVAAYSAPVAA
jgi:PleD family two-component response regulator